MGNTRALGKIYIPSIDFTLAVPTHIHDILFLKFLRLLFVIRHILILWPEWCVRPCRIVETIRSRISWLRSGLLAVKCANFTGSSKTMARNLGFRQCNSLVFGKYSEIVPCDSKSVRTLIKAPPLPLVACCSTSNSPQFIACIVSVRRISKNVTYATEGI